MRPSDEPLISIGRRVRATNLMTSICVDGGLIGMIASLDSERRIGHRCGSAERPRFRDHDEIRAWPFGRRAARRHGGCGRCGSTAMGVRACGSTAMGVRRCGDGHAAVRRGGGAMRVKVG